MSILEELNTLFSSADIPVETGVFSDKTPAQYAVLIPVADTFDLHSDNAPLVEIQETRISLFTKSNYTSLKNKICRLLMDNDFTVTDRRYNGYETHTGYHHYTIDVSKFYETEELYYGDNRP